MGALPTTCIGGPSTVECTHCGRKHMVCGTIVAVAQRMKEERDEYRSAVDAVLAALYEATGDGQTYPLTALGERVRRAIRQEQSLMDYMAERS